MSFFTSANFTFPIDCNDINTWADYCEFFCIISEDKSRTIEELKDKLLGQHEKDYKKARNSIRLTGSVTGKFIISTMEIILSEDDNEIDESIEELDFEDVNENQQSAESLLEDEINSEFLFLFRFIESRRNLFGENYPFNLQIRQNRISLKEEIMSNKQKAYISLLLSSILRIYTHNIQNKLGHLFEKLSFLPFKNMIAVNSEINFFGSGTKVDGDSFFKGSFADKVEKLAYVLKAEPSNIFTKNKHDYQHSGDGGLDWVAWLPFTDKRSKMPVFFGQCACGEDWIDKEWDAHEDKWINLIQLNDSYLLFHFVCKSFRKHDGNWYKPGEIFKLILVDRLRIISSLNEEDNLVSHLYSDLIDEALALNLS